MRSAEPSQVTSRLSTALTDRYAIKRELGSLAVPFFTVLGSLLVENSGNVAIVITTWYGDRTTESTIIGPGETADLTNAPQGTAGTNYVWLYGGGTVSDQSRLPVTQNGQVIFVFIRN